MNGSLFIGLPRALSLNIASFSISRSLIFSSRTCLKSNYHNVLTNFGSVARFSTLNFYPKREIYYKSSVMIQHQHQHQHQSKYLLPDSILNKVSILHLYNNFQIYRNFTIRSISNNELNKNINDPPLTKQVLLNDDNKTLKQKNLTKTNEISLSLDNDNNNENNNNNNNKSGWNDIVRLFKIGQKEIGPMALAIIFLCISSAITVSVPLCIGKILDSSLSESKLIFGLPLNQFYYCISIFFLIGALSNFGRVVILKLIGERVVARLRSFMFKKIITQDSEFFDKNRVGDLISRLGADSNIVARSITQNVSDGLRAIVSGVVGLTMMCYVNLQLTLVMIIVAPPLAIGAMIYGKRIRQISKDLQESVGTLTKVAEEQLNMVKTIQSFNGEVKEVKKYNNQVRNVFSIGKKEALTSGVFFGCTGLVGNFTILSLLIYGTGMVSSGVMSMGDLISFMMYAAYTGSSTFGLSSFYSELMKGTGAASRLFEIIDTNSKIPTTKGLKLNNAKGTIIFENINFNYPTRKNVRIFNNLNFKIPMGSNICIVGPSGSGKSTIISLLLRFYDPVSGIIKIDDKNIKQFNLKSLRQRLGVVQQEPVLINGTIFENVAYGVKHATIEQVNEACKFANCQFINEFPNGLNTQVGPRGTKLSGGQKQRIAIARIIIKNPDILILDEATSALDVLSERLINNTLNKLFSSKSITTISIAHRLSTIKKAELIIVLNNKGEVIEIGKFKELFSNENSELWKLLNDNNNTTNHNTIGNDEIKQKEEEELLLKEQLIEELEQQRDEDDQRDLKLKL